MHPRSPVSLGLAAACIACVACGPDADPALDAGPGLDASTAPLDASTAPLDAGPPVADAGSDAGSPADGGPASTDAGFFADCAEYARWACEQDRCPFDPLVSLFGGVARCERLIESGCERATGEGASMTADDFAQCARAFDCAAPLGAPACTYVPGTRALGEPCETFTQCGAHEGRPMYCAGYDVLSAPGCEAGRCAEATPDGALCDGETCSPPAACLVRHGTGERRCTTDAVRGGEGDPCELGSDRTCTYELSCVDGVCAAGLGEGEPCDGVSQCARGLACSFPMADDPRICRDVDRLIGEDCTGPYDRCPILGSTCVDGVCAETGAPEGGPCEDTRDCTPTLLCRPDDRCGYSDCPD